MKLIGVILAIIPGEYFLYNDSFFAAESKVWMFLFSVREHVPSFSYYHIEIFVEISGKVMLECGERFFSRTIFVNE